MSKKNNLYNLIKSLSKAEKRYFRIFAGSGDNLNYLRLFDEIDSQTEYDESKIKIKFSDAPFIRQLHVTKNYLNKLILKSLRNFNSKLSVETELKDALRNIEILFNKELFDQCSSEVERALKIALEFEKLPTTLNLLEWKRKVLLSRKTVFSEQEDLAKLIEQRQKVSNQLLRENNFWELTINFFSKISREGISKIDVLEKLNPEDTLQSRTLFYHLHYMKNVVGNNIDAAVENLNILISLWEDNPARIKDDPSSYITALNNKLGLLLSEKNIDEIQKLILKIRNVPDVYNLKEKNKVRVKILLRTFNIELEMYRDSGDYEKGIELIGEVDKFLKENIKSVPDDYFVLFYFQFAYIYFMKQQYRKSLHWINELLNLKSQGAREDMLSYARFLNLIIHLELNNIFVLKYSVDSTRRFLKGKRELHNFEKVLLKFFSKISMAHEEKYPQLFEKLKAELFLKTDKKQKLDVLDYIDFEAWIDKRLTAYSKKAMKLPQQQNGFPH